MARLRMSDHHNALDIRNLVNPVVFVVDMVNGFVKEGALHDIAIQAISEPIQQLLERLQCRSIFVADAHPPMAKEFQSYPVHCLIGTSESEVIDELKPYVHELIKKNSTNTFFAPDFQIFLKECMEAYQDIVICGCCSDICIMQFALSLQAYIHEHNLPQHIIVCSDLIETYHAEEVHDAYAYNEFAINVMTSSGITVVRNIMEGE